MKRFFTVLLIIFIVGCSNDAENNTNDITAKNDSEEAVTVDTTETEEKSSILVTIDSVSTDVTIENIKQQSAGILTETISYEEETERVLWGLSDLDPALHTKMEASILEVANETEDPKTLVKALLYYVGSPSFQQIVEELENYEPNFNEPLLPLPERVQEGEVVEGESYSYILLDASSSMLLDSQGRQRMDIAREAVESFAKTIGETSQVSLVAFGHKGDQSNGGKELSCAGIEEVYPLGSYDGESFHEAVSSVEAKGWTPLAAAIEKANELSTKVTGNITIYIVSDGVETCDGDPVKAAKSFVESNNDENRTVNIIGFQVDQDAEKQLAEVADAGNGKYFSANNGEELLSTIEYEWLPSLLELAWAPINLAPDGWEVFRKVEEVSTLSNHWTAAIMRENHRLRTGVIILENEGNISSEIIGQVKELLDAREQQLNSLNVELREEKIAIINEKAAEIRERVEEWVQEMHELKKGN
ncbi:vWA domain-containing protein [Sutcliffiella cohnii]|uniref:vWA domain-containing protein n=1 Tax=Sutcliffiella cohnii TaxID=33932 RepID=UPI002E211B36|nr:VWA domain-containing protein [Sutcliffiella cohnii]